MDFSVVKICVENLKGACGILSKKISMAVIRRLPKYHRYLQDLLDKGVGRISSKELSELIGFTASQIRQDLNNFGGFGQQGYGYNVEELYQELEKILGLHKQYNTILLGAGNLGQAIANYSGFEKSGFRLKALFDISPKLIGTKVKDLDVLSMDDLESFIEKEEVTIAIICIPKERAQENVDRLVAAGIKGIWNFAPVDITAPEHVEIEKVNLSESLFVLSYMLNFDYFDNKEKR